MLKKVFIGIFAGLVSGFFGSGGGMILLPCFVHLLNLKEKEARATCVFAILPMTIASMFLYLNANYIDFEISIKCAIGGIIGGFIGSKLLKKISDKYLQVFFILFLIFASLRMILS